MMATRTEVVAAARACIGAPFRLHGRRPETGLDCIGLAVWIGNSLNLTSHDETDYSISALHGGRLEAGLLRAGLTPAPLALPGDVMVFDTSGQRQHLAVRSRRGLIHADIGSRRVVEHGFAPPWPERLRAVFRFPGLLEE